MGTLRVCLYFLVLLFGSASCYECRGSNMTLCLEPACIQATADILRVMDRDTDPCQDFYQYACGRYADVTHIPAGHLKWTPFQQTQDENRKVVRKIIENDGNNYKGVHSRALEKAKMYYETCLNDTANENAGIAPLLNLIESMGGWSLLGQTSGAGQDGDGGIEQLLASLYKMGIQALFAMDIGVDDRNSSINLLQFQQYGLSLNTPRNYANRDSDRINAFIQLGVKVITLLRQPDGERARERVMAEVRERMERIVDFEIALSKLYIPAEKLNDNVASYNKMPLRKLMAIMPDLDLAGYIGRIFGREVDVNTEVLVYTPSFFRQLTGLVRDTPGSVLRDYSMWFTLRHLLSFMPKAFRDAKFVYHQSYSSAKSQGDLADRCMSEVDVNFNMVTGALFVESKPSEGVKEKSLEILHEIRGAFLETIPTVPWMTEKARVVMEEKARAVTERIGYPDWILDPAKLDAYYGELVVTRNSRLDNIVNYKRFAVQLVLEDLDSPPDHQRWTLGPTRVQAAYDVYANEMVFTSGILQPPFFNNHVPMTMNFGAIGMVMAHELIHGFDVDGIQVDRFGNYGQWGWSEDGFDRHTQCLIDQYSNYRVEDHNINGQQTLSENIADNGGVKVAYLALQRWLARHGRDMQLPLGEGAASVTQEFFLGHGQIWCSYYAPREAGLRAEFDPHAYEKFRVIGPLSNLPAFSEAFQCPLGSPMNPTSKCEVW